MMKNQLVKLASGTIGIAFITLLLIQYKTEITFKEQLDKAVAQQLDYEEMQANFFGDNIVFKGLTLKNLESNDGEFNFKANKLTLDIDYTHALLRNFQVKGIKAEGVSLAFDYSGVGMSNMHDIQQNLRNYINARKAQNKASVDWDVFTIELREVTVELDDFHYGEVGTFAIESITIPHVSSKYSGKSNRDILFLAVAKELSKQFMDEQIQGDYNKDKFAGFIAREAKFEIGSFVQKSTTKMGAKLRSLWQTMNSQQVVPTDDQR